MLIYIVKSSACLVIFLCFYMLFLEKENMHVFKRFYLLFAIALAFGIPLLTFTQYVETSTETVPQIMGNLPLQNEAQFVTSQNYAPAVLWSIYGLGFLIFGILFLKSLTHVLLTIKHNTKLENDYFTMVLLPNFVIPHTFFKYIFINRYKFETQQIPREVLLHEEAHALQKHSLDILCIEILQVIFWFNPLMYVLKHKMKLNHEFLADQAVLKTGINTSTYQNMLLAFSSNALQPQLANAINYSLIKKRFIIMKKQTSKKAVWLRCMLLLPMLSFLLFSFSAKVLVQEEKANTLDFESTVVQEKASQKQILEYNALAKKYNEQPRAKRVFKLQDLRRMEYLYGLMAPLQKRKNEPFPLHPLQHTATPDVDHNVADIEINDVDVATPNIDIAPTNNATSTDHIIGLAQGDAIFDYNGKEISSEKAIALAEVTDFVVQRLTHNPQKVVVYMSENKPSARQIRIRSKKY
jgi:bla regulator protein blaR1